MQIVKTKQSQLAGKTFINQVTVSNSLIGAQVDQLTIREGVAATVTGRTDNATGVLTVSVAGSLSGYISTGNKIGIGWIDPTTGNLVSRMNVTTSISGDVITCTIGTGDNFPLVGQKVVVGLQMTALVDCNTNPIYAQVSDGTSQLALMLAKATDIATPTYANILRASINGINNSLVLNTAAEIASLNASYATADTVYMANVSGATTGTTVKPIVVNVLPITG